MDIPDELEVRATEVWRAVLGDLSLQVPRPAYDTWLRGTVAYAWRDDVLYVAVPTAFALEWLERRMYPTIVAAARKVLGYSVDVRLRVVAEGDRPGRWADLAPPAGETKYERMIREQEERKNR